MLYTTAITQIRADTEGRTYYLRKRAEGKTNREALRCLKRRLSDLVYKTLHEDLATQHDGAEDGGRGTANGTRLTAEASCATGLPVPGPALR